MLHGRAQTRANTLTLIVAGTVIGLLAAMALAAPLLVPHDPLAVHLDHIERPPSRTHLFGTDTIGRDMCSRVISGARYSLLIGLGATAFSLLLGLLAGVTAGYCGGTIDLTVTAVVDLFLAFPSLLLAIAISVVLPPGVMSIIIALCAVGWASFARLFRGLALSCRESLFVDAARAAGCSSLRVMCVHILPQCLPVALVAASLKVGSFILAESALSFLGLGIQPPQPTWGAMVSMYRAYLPSAPWMVFFPGCAIALTVFACNLFGDALRDRLDPNLKL
jgi:peptide/nickel transport system permease protein